MEAAESCKVTSRQTSTHVTNKKMCHPGMMKMYNTLRNQYPRSQGEDDKIRRNDAKMVYVRLCKMKAMQ